jgi:putative FmdB family regulatory protein
MPIYEFHCEDCGKESEALLPTTDWKGTKCPECGSAKLTKKLSVFAPATAQEVPADCGPETCGSCPMRHAH